MKLLSPAHRSRRWPLVCTAFAGFCASICAAQSTPSASVVNTLSAADTKSTTGTTPAAARSLNVVVTVPPLKSLVEPLLPEGSTVTMLMRPGRSEHGYEFTAEDIASLAKADMVVIVGLGLEPRVEQALKRQQRSEQVVINWGDVAGLEQTGEHDHAHDHEHGAGCNHGHGWVDQHLWLDPSMVEQLIPKLADGVRFASATKGSVSEAEQARLDAAVVALQTQVREVDLEYRTALDPFKGRAIVCHHDAYSRMANRYGLKVAAAIKTSTAGEPTAADIAEVVKAIREHDAQAVFIEPQFDPSIAQRVAKAANVRVSQLDPLGDGDWAKMMRRNLHNLTNNLGEKPQASDDGQTPGKSAGR